ncbi:hypothetical protein SAY86_016819 [Trapa natans]|uniref:DUF7138 domain-containing protein n=1 Tax=Trapa natans TaxID=22666 RepID=A0AAN7R5W9_TRANT|nr:hypothetical protein SAY86_016819 [Trapa natans]
MAPKTQQSVSASNISFPPLHPSPHAIVAKMRDATGGQGGISLPVFLHNGEREISIGSTVVHLSLKFNDLQSVISQRLGLFPHQISIYLTDRRLYRSWPRKVAVNANFDFATVSGNKDSYFQVFMKRSKAREKLRCIKNPKLLLKREAVVGDQMYGGRYTAPFVFEYDRQVRELAEMRKRHLMMNIMNSYIDYARVMAAEALFCEECEKAKETASESSDSVPEFHFCQNDMVVIGFRSSAGPVCRPEPN